MTRIGMLVALVLVAAGCREKPADDTAVGGTDGGGTDGGGTDGGTTDGGSTDGGSTDGGSTDGGSTDGGTTDGGTTDGGGTGDSGTGDSGTGDTGAGDTGTGGSGTGGTGGGTDPASPYDGYYIGAFTLEVTQGGFAYYEESCELSLSVRVDSEAEPQLAGSGSCELPSLGTATIELSAALPEGGGDIAGELVYTQEGLAYTGTWEGAITEKLLTGSFSGAWEKGEASASWRGAFELGRVEAP